MALYPDRVLIRADFQIPGHSYLVDMIVLTPYCFSSSGGYNVQPVSIGKPHRNK